MSDDGMQSDECDEKRSYTPEPRQPRNMINDHSKNQLNRSVIGIQK